MKKILGIYGNPQQHWVGDGFPVRSLFSYNSQGAQISPFLLLDYAGPMRFDAAARPRGVGEHPHRGFETVTIVYEGEVSHRDSTGAGGTIRPGDVQWMTAASGILHDEFHSPEFTKTGGTLEMVQLWVNLPAKDKMAAPKYQTLLNTDIPSISIDNDGGRVRVIAGEYNGHTGPANTFTPVNVWDVRLRDGHSFEFDAESGQTVMLVVLQGTVSINAEDVVQAPQAVVFDRERGSVAVAAAGDAKLLVLGGEPIDEPIVGYGPFVMNDEAGIKKAITDFNSGHFGRIPETR